jgi:GR25 family glycosyltransferase involved in LPS biosynthesis
MVQIYQDFDLLDLDILLLGHLATYVIDDNTPGFRRIPISNTPYCYYDYHQETWGTQMYMISRKYAKQILDKYYVGYLEKTLEIPDQTPFSADWTITKDGRRALIYPLLVVEDGKSVYTHWGQQQFHRHSYTCNYVKGVHI